jgi:signal transduction histidine kinase
LSGDLKKQLKELALPQFHNVELIEAHLAEALTQADAVSRGLYPVELETHGLMAALDEMAHKVSTTFSVQCRLKYAKPIYVSDPSVATHVYRIAQEAVTNAIKSGQAKHITIRLAGRTPRMMLSITDDGIGLRGHSLRKGMGLKIMQYRTRMLNATLKLRSREHGWTRVGCLFPLSPLEENDAHA